MPRSTTYEPLHTLDGITSVSIDTDAASIDVLPTDDGVDTVRVALVERDGTPRPDLLTVTHVGDEARINVSSLRDGRWRRNRTIDVQLVVHAPRAVPVKVVSEVGAIRIEGRDADVTVTSQAGATWLRDVHGTIALDSSAGKITLTESSGDATVAGLAGAVRIDRHTGSRLDLRASAGGVKGDELDVEHVTAVTEAGAIVLRFDTPPLSVDASCTVGAVTLALPDCDYDIDQQAGMLGRTRLDGLDHVPGAERTIRTSSTVGAVTITLAAPTHA